MLLLAMGVVKSVVIADPKQNVSDRAPRRGDCRTGSHLAAEAEVAATRLRLSKEDYRTVFELAGIGVTRVAPVTGRHVRVDQDARIHRLLEDELLGMAFSLITHPHDWKEDSERFRRMVGREMSEYVVEKRYPHKHGSVAG